MNVPARLVGIISVILAAGVILAVLLSWTTIKLFRWRHPVPARPVKATVPAWGWVAIVGYGTLTVGLVAFEVPSWFGVPSLLVMLFMVMLPVLAWEVYRRLTLFSFINRVSRQANRGDLAGAIVRLQAVIDRHPTRTDSPPHDPADPWAPPRSAAVRDLPAANRFNTMGIFQARRNDWPAALEWFRRAVGAGGGESIFRLNLGEALVMLGRAAEGLPIALAAIQKVPLDGDPVKRYGLALSLARTLADVANWSEAARQLDEAAEAIRLAPIFRARIRAQLNAEINAVRGRLPSAQVRASVEEAVS